MFKSLLRLAKRIVRKAVLNSIPEINYLREKDNQNYLLSKISNSDVSIKAKLYPMYHVSDSTIGDYTYISKYSHISLTEIGKFCSIGPNFLCGWGIHPLNGISTSPMFYSTMMQNGISLSTVDKIVERKLIRIGNDVFIGANVTILDGVTVGDGAVIGAGAVVSKDIPPYAVAVGNPIQIKRYRFDENTIAKLLGIRWWDDADKLSKVERYFFDVDKFILCNE